MAQALIKAFIRDLAEVLDLPDPVVEFGSMQVEPDQEGDLRPLFPRHTFIGTDFREGPGVDRVEDLRNLSLADGTVGTAICLDTLEHCEDPVTACRELCRVTAPGGVCVISSVMLFGIHGYPSDYFRFTPEAFRVMLAGFDDIWVAGIGDPDIPMQVVGVAAKDRALHLSLDRLPSLARAQAEWDLAERRVRIGPFRVPIGDLAGILARELPRIVWQRMRSTRRAYGGSAPRRF